MLSNSRSTGKYVNNLNALTRHLISLLVLFLIAHANDAYAGFSRGGAFQYPGYGARAWGMGGAVAASIDDESAVYWNPAFLSILGGSSLGLSYVDLLPGVTARQSFLSYGRIIKRMPEEVNEAGVARHAAGLMYGNLALELSDDMTYSENIFRLAYSYSPDYFISFGVGADVLISSGDLNDFDSKGSAFHLGLRLRIAEHTSAGFVMRNIFSRIMFADGTDQTLARITTLALSNRPLSGLLLESDMEIAYGGISRLTLGGQYEIIGNALEFRSALSVFTAGETRTVPYFGLGINVRRYSFHYNADLDIKKAFGDSHRFSLSIRI